MLMKFWNDLFGEFVKERVMKVSITEECIACERCVEICPEVFQMGETYAEVKDDVNPADYADAVQQAADECPVSAIIVEE